MLEQKIYVSYGDKPKELIKEVLSNLKIESYIKKDAVNVPDCPPTAKDIIDILKHKLNS